MMDNEEYSRMFRRNMQIDHRISILEDRVKSFSAMIEEFKREHYKLRLELMENSTKMDALSKDHA